MQCCLETLLDEIFKDKVEIVFWIFNRLPFEKYKNIINYALDNNIPIGADSCSGSNLIKATKHRKEANEIFKLVDPCESFRMSIYIGFL